MPAIKLYPVQVFCQIKLAHQGFEGGVTNEDIIGVSGTGFFIRSSPNAFETCHEILVLEFIEILEVSKRVGSVHYQFKLAVQHYLSGEAEI